MCLAAAAAAAFIQSRCHHSTDSWRVSDAPTTSALPQQPGPATEKQHNVYNQQSIDQIFGLFGSCSTGAGLYV